MLRKTVLIKVDDDKCENKEEIALTPISSLKPFTGQVPAQKLSTRRRRRRRMTVNKDRFWSSLKHSAGLLRGRRSRRSRKRRENCPQTFQVPRQSVAAHNVLQNRG